MDPRSGDFVPVLGRSYRRRPLDRRWILARFPPELERARPSGLSSHSKRSVDH
jgi:hypothetical protein